MRGIILVGGYGTRLQPLTNTRPKSLIPFANKPIIQHQIEELASAGVSEIILAVGHMHEQMKDTLDKYSRRTNTKIVYSYEKEAMGTGGALAIASKMLQNDNKPFFVLNSDVICDFPFAQMIEYHRTHGGTGTIVTTQVDDPSRYGVVMTDQTEQIQAFIEKPREYISNRINAGIYLFSRDILEYLEVKRMSIETDVLPRLIQNSVVKAYNLAGYWMDIGQPKDYIRAHAMYIQHMKTKDEQRNRQNTVHREESKEGSKIQEMGVADVLVDKTAQIAQSAVLEYNTVIGPQVKVGENAKISNSVILQGTHIMDGAVVRNSIVGWNCIVGEGCIVDDYSVLGEYVVLENGAHIRNKALAPDTTKVQEQKIVDVAKYEERRILAQSSPLQSTNEE